MIDKDRRSSDPRSILKFDPIMTRSDHDRRSFAIGQPSLIRQYVKNFLNQGVKSISKKKPKFLDFLDAFDME